MGGSEGRCFLTLAESAITQVVFVSVVRVEPAEAGRGSSVFQIIPKYLRGNLAGQVVVQLREVASVQLRFLQRPLGPISPVCDCDQ